MPSAALRRERTLSERRAKLLAPHRSIADLEAENARLRAALTASDGAATQRDLVTQELKHRIRNLLAVVQALARQTFRNADAERMTAFSSRLTALVAAQDLLIQAETGDTMLIEAVRLALAPHDAPEDRVAILGPAVSLSGRRAHALALALHELATNAAKYGALAVQTGSIAISWSIEEGVLTFIWREEGGPYVV
ncbi:MAG: sensor histidine kinase, partial [Alphaproteobacteria bacterium]|nr:sensor histidine kinase [Alphaproteobacteria bacterium]